jgi:hypothetical protein
MAMKTSFHPYFIYNEDNEVMGLFFDNGYCGEHEMGISSLQRDFQIDTTLLGLDGRKIKECPKELTFVKYKQRNVKRAYLHYSKFKSPYNLTFEEQKKCVKDFYYVATNKKESQWISVAWCRDSFCIYAAGSKNVDALEKIYNSFKGLDVDLFVGSDKEDNPFYHGGLVLLIDSLVSKEDKKEYYDKDLDIKTLMEKAKPYIDLLGKADKRFYCCEPYWVDKEKGSIRFWLNPCDQDNCYWGDVSPQDLIDWSKDEGIIPNHGTLFQKEHPDEYKIFQSQINSMKKASSL